LGDLGIEASTAKLPVAFFDGTDVDDIVVWRDLPARTATKILDGSDVVSIHFH
jgi:hypothetical protein